MASRRTKSIGTKVTREEYDRIHALAGGQPISEWVRAALLKAAADPPAADSIVLAELLSLRTILLIGSRVTLQIVDAPEAQTADADVPAGTGDKSSQRPARGVGGSN